MDGSQTFSSPLLNRRAAPLSTATSIRFVGVANRDGSVVGAYGKTHKHLEDLFKHITTNSLPPSGKLKTQPFLDDKEVKNVLKKGREQLGALVDYEQHQLGHEYGRLGQAVEELTRTWDDKGNGLSDEEKALQLLLDGRKKISVDEGGQRRKQLTEYLLLVADISSQGDADEFRDRTKHFVRFLLDFLLPHGHGKDKYVGLLTVMGLNIEDEVSSGNDVWDFKTAAKQAIIAEIVGDASMETVVSLFDSKALAEFTFSTGKDEKRVLVKTMRPICKMWMTDDFGLNQATVEEEVVAYTGGEVSDNVSDAGAGDAPSLSALTAGTCSPKIIHLRSLLNQLASLATGILDDHGNGELTPAQVADHRLTIARLLAEALDPAPSGALTVVTATTATSSSVGGSSRGDMVSPLTLPNVPRSFSFQEMNNGFGSANNGLSLTKKGLICCLQKLRDRDDCPALLRQYLQKHLTEEWGVDVGDPTTPLERALAGCKFTEEDLGILGVLGGGAFGRVFAILYKNYRAAMKVECFTANALKYYLARELIEGTKVKSPHIVRVLGFLPLPCVVNQNKPICMGLIQELCLHNLRKIIRRLHNELELAPRDMLREVCKIIDQVLMAVRDMEEAGVMHRDLKPENIMEAKDGKIKVMQGNLTEDAGTGPYIPPEGRGPKHDIYSAAVVWFELMTNSLPKDINVRDKASLVHAFKLETVKEASEVLDLFMHMIEPDENVRWTAKQASPAMKKVLESLSKDA